jgi:hypothetical protein
MNNSQESNYFIPILSAIAGIGAVVTVLSPFILHNNKFASLFVDSSSVQYASIIAVIISVITIWYASSNQSFEAFPSGRSLLFKLLLGFIFLSILFYSLKPLTYNKVLNMVAGTILQLTAYVFGYVIISLIVGLLLRESFGGYRYQKLQQEKFDRLREALFKSGLLKANLTIHSFVQRQFNNNEPHFFGAYNVIFETDNGKYFAIISSDFTQVLDSEIIKKEQENKKNSKSYKELSMS